MGSVLWAPWGYRRQKQGHGRAPTTAKCSTIFFDCYGDSDFAAGFEPHTRHTRSVKMKGVKRKASAGQNPFFEQAVSG